MNPTAAIVMLGAVAGVLLVLCGWLLIGRRRTPEEMERARRLLLSARGRIVEAEITDIHGALVGYSYDVGGVTYHVVQDLTPFLDVLPRDANLLIGPATAKYSTGNPANSILVSEEWSGIRMARPIPIARQKGA
ncbi:MAG: hypothetical protein JNK48_27490 [Bryobacterales bacterium]|nr:hypothetical protein [Bryobacterales bacterium]